MYNGSGLSERGRITLWFEFEDFKFTPASGELTKSGVRLRLNEQTAQVLTLLLANHGKLVAREKIRELLWPNGPVVEHEKAINNCISRLREAFQDDPLNPKFIERLPKRGYRFVAIAKRVTLEDDETPVHRSQPRIVLAMGSLLARRSLFPQPSYHLPRIHLPQVQSVVLFVLGSRKGDLGRKCLFSLS